MNLLKVFRRSQKPTRSANLDPSLMVHARYDAAQDSNETKNIWSAADALDADSANSLAVRTKLRKRSRYERGNNGHNSGIIRTHANYVIGRGPKLRVQTRTPTFNVMIEEKWLRWCKAVHFSSKLRTMNRAKTGDGEAFALLLTNQRIDDPVKLDFRPIECDQVTAPVGKSDTENYIDGIHYDEFGNPTAYDILNRHPGSAWYSTTFRNEYKTYSAENVCHWFGGDKRPGQHRGVPELTPTLNLFATGRRYREAVVAAAETAADFAAMIEMGVPAEGPDELAGFSTLPIDKRTFTVLPAGAKGEQMKAEQPATTYDSFTRSMICEEARPLNMPYNIAACDSSGYSYSGGQLDHQTYFQSLDVEQEDCESEVLDKVFASWFREATKVYGWLGDGTPPVHGWAWVGKPHSDPTKIADARKTRLSCGDISPSECAAEDGVDFEDRIAALAADYGVSVEKVKAKMFQANFQQSGGSPNQARPDDIDQSGDEPKPTNGKQKTNGVNRVSAMFSESLS